MEKQFFEKLDVSKVHPSQKLHHIGQKINRFHLSEGDKTLEHYLGEIQDEHCCLDCSNLFLGGLIALDENRIGYLDPQALLEYLLNEDADRSILMSKLTDVVDVYDENEYVKDVYESQLKKNGKVKMALIKSDYHKDMRLGKLSAQATDSGPSAFDGVVSAMSCMTYYQMRETCETCWWPWCQPCGSLYMTCG